MSLSWLEQAERIYLNNHLYWLLYDESATDVKHEKVRKIEFIWMANKQHLCLVNGFYQRCINGRIFGAKPLPQPMITYRQLHPQEHFLILFEIQTLSLLVFVKVLT